MATDVKVSLTIEGADAAGKKSSTKIPYINPNISDTTMKNFAEKCAALSNDTYIGTTKTTEEDITNGGSDDGLEDAQYAYYQVALMDQTTAGSFVPYMDLSKVNSGPESFMCGIVSKAGTTTASAAGTISVSGYKPKSMNLTIQQNDHTVGLIKMGTTAYSSENQQLFTMRINIAATDTFKAATLYQYIFANPDDVEEI